MARAEDIRAFARRDWGRAAAHKRAYWASLTPAERFRMAASLWEHARAQLAVWPDPASRVDDFRHHVDLERKLAAVAHAFPRR